MSSPRQPICFVHRNLVFARDIEDAWALYRVATHSYSGLTRPQKLEQLARLAAFAYGAAADFQILRVAAAWPVDAYLEGARAGLDARHGHPERLDKQLALDGPLLASRGTGIPHVFLSVKLGRGGTPDSAPPHRMLGGALTRALGLRDPRAISRRALDRLYEAEAKAFRHAHDFLDCERATTRDLQWLVKRSFSRALGEPLVEELFRPQALVVDTPEGRADSAFRPLQVDLLRLFDEPINIERRSLRVETDSGDSHQAFLVAGALPDSVTFPGRHAELLFAPLEAVSFPVDAAFSARHIANERAVALARRRIVDADHVYREESSGDHGPSANSLERPQVARELERYLTSTERPPLLRAQLSLCVAATSAAELDERVEELRREFGTVQLHRPLGEQLRLFIAQLPAQLSPLGDYDDYMVVEQLGAMVPTATHAVGAERGLYIGRTLSGSARPVLFDINEAPRTSRPPAILCAGAPGSGKTVAAQLLAYQAFLLGSRVIDLDPKGDHRLAELCGERHVERTVLTPEERYRGMLDPLRIGSDETRADLAFNFLLEVLPSPVLPAWQTELRIAVDAVVVRGGRTCGDVVDQLEQGNADAREAARAIRVHAGAGLLRLGFGVRERPLPLASDAQVISITIANLKLPDPRTPKADFSTEERIGNALLHLLAAHALELVAGERTRHKTLVFDEAWMLLGTPTGRALVQRINRLGRSQNATPILATQTLAEVGDMDGLIGAIFAFGVESDEEARRLLRMLHLDPEDPRRRQALVAYRRGACLMRDYSGRVAEMQVEIADPSLLATLDTTPSRLPQATPSG